MKRIGWLGRLAPWLFALGLAQACGDDAATLAANAQAGADAGVKDGDVSQSPDGAAEIADIAEQSDPGAAGDVSDPGALAAADEPGDSSETTASPLWPAWLSGTWQDCTGDWTISPDGTWTWLSIDQGCSRQGTAVWTGQLLDLTATDGACPAPIWLQKGLGISVQGDILTLVHSTFVGMRKFTKGGIDRQRWQVTELQSQTQSNLDLCYDSSGAFFSGKFKALNQCVFLACGGVVDDLQKVNGQPQLWTHCVGSCGCSGLVVVEQQATDSLSGHYATADCYTGHGGTFSAIAVPFAGP